MPFRTEFSKNIFEYKYKHEKAETWEQLSKTLIEDVCGGLLPQEEIDELIKYHSEMKFIAGGRYLYYAGRLNKFFNNCFLLKACVDNREDWADLSWKSESCLMTGGGIGIDYSVYRPKGSIIKRTGGHASGTVSKMEMINEIGRRVMQGGSRRSAIYASLNWKHGDVEEFLHAKDWYNMPISGAFDENGNQLTIGKLKELDFNYHAPLDMTNVSLNYDNDFLEEVYGKSFDELKEIYKKEGSMGIFNLPIVSLPIVFIENCRQALKTGEPGFSFNFFEKVIETLRNAPIVGETWVLTKEGYKQVLDIVGREVEVWTGLQWAKTIFTKTRKDSPTVTVTMTGRKEITCSPDHEFITSDGRRIAAKDLDIGEQLKVSLGVYTHGKIVRDAYLLGFAYGDGSFHKKYSRLEIPLCSDKIKCKDRILDSIIQPLSCNEDIRGIYRMYYGNNDLFSNRNKKEFPSDVFSWDFNSRKSFLEGLLDADGNTSLGHARLSSVNFEFLKGVGRLCETLGLTCGINKGSNGGFKNTPSWNLIIKGDTDFLKTERVNIEKSNPIIFKVVSIEESNISDVFCCNVGVDEHSFQAEGIIISNCTEVTSADDSDVCNLGSINMSRIKTIDEFIRVNYLASKFLVCGTLKATLPYQKIYEVREKNRRLGLGLMGVHEWLLQRGYKYEVVPELHDWLKSYKEQSELGANQLCKQLNISKPVAYRAIAPTGTIGIMAG